MHKVHETCGSYHQFTPPDNRNIFFRYRRKGTDIMIGASFAWLIAIVVLAIVRPEVFGVPAELTMIWKWMRGG